MKVDRIAWSRANLVDVGYGLAESEWDDFVATVCGAAEEWFEQYNVNRVGDAE